MREGYNSLKEKSDSIFLKEYESANQILASIEDIHSLLQCTIVKSDKSRNDSQVTIGDILDFSDIANRYECPSCNQKLELINNELKIVKELQSQNCHNNIYYSDQLIENVKRNRQNIMHILREGHISKDAHVSKLRDMKIKYRQILNEKEKCEKRMFQQVEKINSLEVVLYSIQNCIDIDSEETIDIQYIDDEISRIKTLLEKCEYDRNRKNALDDEISDLSQKLSELNVKDVDSIQEEINGWSEKLTLIVDKLRVYEEKYRQLLEYEEQEKHSKAISKFKSDLKEAKGKYNDISLRYEALEKLRTKTIQAELLALDGVIDNINSHAKQYLDLMFVDPPISASITQFKKLKSNDTKFSLNVRIQYKGNGGGR